MNTNIYNQNKNTLDIDAIRRWVSIIISLVLLLLSIKFSIAGFGDGVNQKDQWIGIVLAITVNGIELVWNGMGSKTNLTLWAAGMLAYLYGIYTNVVGIFFWQGHNFEQGMAQPWLFIFPIIVGLFLEIVPEPLFIWGLTGKHNDGDFLSNLFGNNMIPKPDKKPSQSTQQQRPINQPSSNTTQKLPKSNREEYQKNTSQNQKPNKDKQELTYSQRPSNNPKNDFFKPVQNNKPDNLQAGRYLELMKQKEKGNSSNTFPYEHSDDQPDW